MTHPPDWQAGYLAGLQAAEDAVGKLMDRKDKGTMRNALYEAWSIIKRLPVPGEPKADKSTPWWPAPHLPGYEVRTNSEGYSETRKSDRTPEERESARLLRGER